MRGALGLDIWVILQRSAKSAALVCLLLSTGFSVLSSSAAPNHRRLFFDTSGLDRLKVKSTNELAKECFDALVRNSKWYVSRPAPKPSDYSGQYVGILGAAQPLVGGIESMAFYWLITKNETYALAATKYMLSLRQWDTWSSDALTMGFICRGLAVGYDWLYDYLQPGEKAIVRDMIRTAAMWIYVESLGEEAWWTQAYACNWLAIAHSGLGLAGLALWEELPDSKGWVSLAQTKIEKYLDSGGPDGGWGEGLHYWQYGLIPILLFADGLRNITGQDLFKHPWLEAAWRFPVYCLSPRKQGLVNFGDSDYRLTLTQQVGVCMVKLATEYRNGFAQWFVHATQTLKKERVSAVPWTFIWYDPSIPATDPVVLPTSFLFRGLGWAIMRSGWKSDDVLFAMKSGQAWKHGHADQNSFTLEYLGERLVTDPGYGPQSDEYFSKKDIQPYIASIGHNTVLINSVGQTIKTPDRRPEPWGLIGSFISADGYDYVLGDASATYSYPMRSFIRQVAFVKPSYFLLHDELSASKPSSFSWLLHSAGKIEVRGDLILIQGSKSSLLLNILSPQKWIYQILYDQKHMVEWQIEEPIQYIKIEPENKTQSTDFLVLMVPTLPNTVSIPMLVDRIYENQTLGATISRGDAIDTHLYSPTKDRVTVGNIEFEGRSCFISSKAVKTVQQFALHDGTSLKFAKSAFVASSKPLSIVMTLRNDTAEGNVETTDDCILEMDMQDQPATVILDGNRFEDYRYDAEKQTLIMPMRKGLHSLKIEALRSVVSLLTRAERALSWAKGVGKEFDILKADRMLADARLAFNSTDYGKAKAIAGALLEIVSMKMDGSDADWKGIRQIVTDVSGDAKAEGTDILGVLGVIDNEHLYLMMRISGQINKEAAFVFDIDNDGKNDYAVRLHNDYTRLWLRKTDETISKSLEYGWGDIIEVKVPLRLMQNPTTIKIKALSIISNKLSRDTGLSDQTDWGQVVAAETPTSMTGVTKPAKPIPTATLPLTFSIVGWMQSNILILCLFATIAMAIVLYLRRKGIPFKSPRRKH